MQPLILLAIVGVAAVALGAGSLTNVIQLTVQDFGVGEETINSPVSNANVNFNIGQTTTGGFLYNVVDFCYITADRNLDALSTVFCKLTDAGSNIVAEGNTVLQTAVASGTPITIAVDNLADPNPPFSNNVKNVHDVMVVIQAP